MNAVTPTAMPKVAAFAWNVRDRFATTTNSAAAFAITIATRHAYTKLCMGDLPPLLQNYYAIFPRKWLPLAGNRLLVDVEVL